MVEVDYTANVAEAAVECATIIIETIVEAVEDMAAAASTSINCFGAPSTIKVGR